ncbi:uncharacterized protein Gm31309 [Mus musculus]|uniref:uncharacterized protein Gm31309 n=1 Tax=Mus musculus TaxID=10090 RepID=UPI0003D6FFCC|nr:uncharacterized protein Gm31309 [Mus musculus]|eukprot:XP_017175992.1 PREDICTED: uncharacterized protein Gm31309 [Mus musculus]
MPERRKLNTEGLSHHSVGSARDKEGQGPSLQGCERKMNWRELVSHRRQNATGSTRRLGSHALCETTRAHLAAQEVKAGQTSQSTCRSLDALQASQAVSLPLLQKPKEGEHHPLRAVSAGRYRTPATEGLSSLPIRERLQSFVKRLELETRRGSLRNPKEAWTEKTLEARAPVETQGKEGTMAFSNQANNPGNKPQSPQGQLHKDLWKDIDLRYSIASPRKGLQMVSYCPKPEGNLEGHVLEGKKIYLKPRSPVQEMSMYSLEESLKEEIQTPKEKVKEMRANPKEREAQSQFSKEKAFLQKKLWDLGPAPVGGTRLLDKKKTQALELSPRDHHSKSGPRTRRQNLQPLAQDVHNTKVPGNELNMEKRKLRRQWWDPTVWGSPITLAKREQSPRKTCSKVHSDQGKLSFPTGRSSF